MKESRTLFSQKGEERTGVSAGTGTVRPLATKSGQAVGKSQKENDQQVWRQTRRLTDGQGVYSPPLSSWINI